mmetsp:Transcript_147938/g.412052  ORF Transcript_147938/g.412052 Transcript_147938/m.412052 type:complete len:555 (+) Transcript_147938:714-2378(+)
MHQGRDVPRLLGDLHLDLPLLALLLGEPFEGPRVPLRVLGVQLAATADADPLQDLRIGGRDLALVDFLAVHRADARVGRGFLVLLEVLPVREVEPRLAVGELQPLLHDPARRLHRVLVRLLLGARQLVHVGPSPPIGEGLGGLDQEQLSVLRPVLYAEQHHVHHSDDVLVPGGVNHQARGAVPDLVDELPESLGVALAEALRGDFVVLQRLLDVLLAVALRGARGLVRRSHLGPNEVGDTVCLGPRLRPPLELGSPLCLLLDDLEAALLPEFPQRQHLVPPRAHVCGLLQTPHQLAAPLRNAGVGAGLLDVGREVHLLHLLVLVLPRRLHERVQGGLLRAETILLLPLEELVEQVPALLGAPRWDHDLLVLDVILSLEGEAARHKAIHDDPNGPDVNLEAVVHREELGRPVGLRPALRGEPLLALDLAHGAEVAQEDAALRVLDVLPVHEVVVALDVAVHDLLGVQKVQPLADLPGVLAHEAYAVRPKLVEHPLDRAAGHELEEDQEGGVLLRVLPDASVVPHDPGVPQPLQGVNLKQQRVDLLLRGLDVEGQV